MLISRSGAVLISRSGAVLILWRVRFRRGLRKRYVRVAFDCAETVPFEEDSYSALLKFAAILFQGVEVIPAFLAERVGDQRSAKQEADLASGHAGFEVLQVLRFNYVALLNRWRIQGNTAGQQQYGEQ